MDDAVKLAKIAAVALAAFAVVSFVQRNVMAIPVIGEFLPK